MLHKPSNHVSAFHLPPRTALKAIYAELDLIILASFGCFLMASFFTLYSDVLYYYDLKRL